MSNITQFKMKVYTTEDVVKSVSEGNAAAASFIKQTLDVAQLNGPIAHDIFAKAFIASPVKGHELGAVFLNASSDLHKAWEAWEQAEKVALEKEDSTSSITVVQFPRAPQ